MSVIKINYMRKNIILMKAMTIDLSIVVQAFINKLMRIIIKIIEKSKSTSITAECKQFVA